MNKKFDYEELSLCSVECSPKHYAKISANRVHLHCRRYELTDKVYFEYWGPEEWEFTVCATDKMESILVAENVANLTLWLRTKYLTESRLPNLLAICKSELMKTA